MTIFLKIRFFFKGGGGGVPPCPVVPAGSAFALFDSTEVNGWWSNLDETAAIISHNTYKMEVVILLIFFVLSF